MALSPTTPFVKSVLGVHAALEEVACVDHAEVIGSTCVVMTLKPIDTRRAAERVAWALMKSAGGMTIDAAAFTAAAFTREFCTNWLRHALVWSPLKQVGLFCMHTLRARAEALIRDAEKWSHGGQALLEFATTPDRSEILDSEMKPFVKYEAYQAFFNFIGERYQCAYCLNNHACMVAGCTQRPSDAYCPNFRIKGETFRYEFRHQDDGIGGTIHACGRHAKSMLFYKKELVKNWTRSRANWARGRGRTPREWAFHKCTLKDGRCYHIDEMWVDGDVATREWWLYLLKHAKAHPSGDLLIKELGQPKDNGLDKERQKEKARVRAEKEKARAERLRAIQESRATRIKWEVDQEIAVRARARAAAAAAAAPLPALVVVEQPTPRPTPRREWQSAYIGALIGAPR